MLRQDQENLEIFVGREVEQKIYRVLLEGEEEYWLLFLTGIPGIGKTSLLRQLKKQTPDTTGIIEINFQDIEHYPYLLTDPLQVLEALAHAARSFCNEAQYTEFQKTLQRGDEDIQRFNEEIKQLEQINGPEQLAQIKQNMLTAEQEIQRNTWKIVSSAFYALIDTIEKRDLVLMLDTCERLLEPGGLRVGYWLMNEFLPMLHNRVDQLDKRCFVVIASRELLPSDIIGEREQQQLALSFFTPEEINDYLEQAGISVKKGSLDFQSIFQMTQGHPLSLSIIRNFWQKEDEKPAGEKNEDLAAFQSEIADRVSETFVEERILKRLAFPYKQLTEYAVLLRSFSLPQLQAIFPDLLPASLSYEQVSKIFDRFTNYPYIDPLGGYRYTFHEFVREALAKNTRELHHVEWKQYHKRAFEFFTPEEGFMPTFDDRGLAGAISQS